MPYLQGITLHEWMKSHPQPSQDELEAIFVPLLEGLKYIHDRNLLHRDIKPENIYILENGHPILIDFGSARMAIGQKSKALTQILTPHFAPIEQYRSKGTFTPALDLYSFAACMYQAITGEMPEEAPNRLEEDEQRKLVGRDYEKRYSTHFLQAIDKCLSLYAKDRYQNGFNLQKDLVWRDEKNDKKSDVAIKCVKENVYVQNNDKKLYCHNTNSTDDNQNSRKTLELWSEARKYFNANDFISAKQIASQIKIMNNNDIYVDNFIVMCNNNITISNEKINKIKYFQNKAHDCFQKGKFEESLSYLKFLFQISPDDVIGKKIYDNINEIINNIKKKDKPQSLNSNEYKKRFKNLVYDYHTDSFIEDRNGDDFFYE